MTASRLLTKTFPDVFSIPFTALMEDELDKVEEGSDEWSKVVDDFYRPFSRSLGEAEKRKAELKSEVQEETDILCDRCGRRMVKKFGRNGLFLACPGYPECKGTKPLETDERVLVDQACPACGKPMAVKRGRFGRFLACTDYPDCKTTLPYRIGVTCPLPNCGGNLVEKRSRKGRIFYGCDRYPECNFVSWARPVPEPCPHCGNPFLIERTTKARGSVLRCPKCRRDADEEES
jgi:DNA topoisomerase-1